MKSQFPTSLLIYLLVVAFGAYLILELNLAYPINGFALIVYGVLVYWYAQKKRLIK